METHIDAFISRMNFVQAKTATNQEETKAAIKSSRETMETRMNA
jgi:hypothetical protein